MERNLWVCIDCCKDKYLKKFVRENSPFLPEVCTICKKRNISTDARNYDLLILIRALIRYHIPEEKYNSHFGGDSIESLLRNENPIVNENLVIDKSSEDDEQYEDYDELIAGFCSDPYPKDEISLYAGFYTMPDGTDFRLCNSIPLKDESSQLWKNIEKELYHKNYYEIEADVLTKLSPVFILVKTTLAIDTVFYRSRIGFVETNYDGDEMFKNVMVKLPYSNNKIAAPPPLYASPGRVNRHGVSVLYLSSEINTAISETRPHPGHYVSVGAFKLNKKLSIVDLREIDLNKFSNSDDTLDRFVLLQTLSNLLSIPITPEEKGKYLISQFLSDIIRKAGYDGIFYNSSVGHGFNLACFFPDFFEFIETSENKLVKITKSKHDFMEVITLEDDIYGYPREELI